IREERCDGEAQSRRQTVEHGSGRAALAPLDERDHRSTHAGPLGQAVERELALDPELAEPGGQAGMGIGQGNGPHDTRIAIQHAGVKNGGLSACPPVRPSAYFCSTVSITVASRTPLNWGPPDNVTSLI